jgi:hypothetical protein
MSSRTPGWPLATVAALLAVVAAAGCSDAAGSPHEAEVTATPGGGKPADDGRRIDVTIAADGGHPSGKRVGVQTGAPVTLVIHATTHGELHVHSSPEQHVAYPRGTSTATLRIDRPGLVDVESHQLDELVVRLEVR